MLVEMDYAPAVVRPSPFWQNLNRQHMDCLAKDGIDAFKRTLARSYFTWPRVMPWDSQIGFLVSHLPLSATVDAAARALDPPKHDKIPLFEGLALNFLTRLLWAYARRQAPEILNSLSEPDAGSPPRIAVAGRLASQDLAHSALEHQSMAAASAEAKVICELGGGYGRNAYVTASLNPRVKYILVDIPPAIAIAQAYIGEVFPERRHFKFRPFADFAAIRNEFEAANFIFLLPHQMSLLPEGYIDLFVNISSLHQMRQDQVDHYLSEIRRLVRPSGHFYLKAWKVSNNPDKAARIHGKDYDLTGWTAVYRRTPKVQSGVFETLLQKTAES